MRFDPQKHHCRSIRLKGFDYSQAGAYFVTLVAWRREVLFGEIVNGEMVSNKYGRITDECLRAIPDHFANVELRAHVVMPNHLHGIVVIHDEKIGMATNPSPLRTSNVKPGSLGAIVRSFKSAVTRRIHPYIESNPSMWAEDDENPDCPP